MILIGSFYDLDIAKTCYIGQYPSDNIFGIVFSYIGIIPTFVGWSFLGTVILFLSKNVSQRRHKILIMIIAIFQYVLSFFFFCNNIMFTNHNILKVHWLIAYGVGIIVLLLSVYGGYLFAKKSNNPNLLNEALFISLISILTMFVAMIVKEVMARPRYIFVLETNDYNFFINWWESGHSLKNSVSSSVISENFKSFPSGHSAYSMFAIFIFPFLIKFNKTSQKHEFILFICGIIWWGLTSYSRITVGAHYLTDVCFGGLITLISYLIIHLTTKKCLEKVYEIKYQNIFNKEL
jgi:membrane-associated phospholipid phosphatase